MVGRIIELFGPLELVALVLFFACLAVWGTTLSVMLR